MVYLYGIITDSFQKEKPVSETGFRISCAAMIVNRANKSVKIVLYLSTGKDSKFRDELDSPRLVRPHWRNAAGSHTTSVQVGRSAARLPV